MANQKKSISKSVRISEEVYSYIDSAPGKGFNEKFENIILDAQRTESDRKKELARLERQIREARQELSKLLSHDRDLKDFFRIFSDIQHRLTSMKDALDRAYPEYKPNNND